MFVKGEFTKKKVNDKVQGVGGATAGQISEDCNYHVGTLGEPQLLSVVHSEPRPLGI